MNFIVDIILLAIIALSIVVGARKGFAHMTVSLVGTVLAVAISFAASTPVAQLVYKACFENKVSSAVDSVLEQNVTGSADQAIDQLFSDGGIVSKLASTCGISAEDAKSRVGTESILGVSNSLKNDIIKPAMTSLIRIIALIVLLVVLLFVVSILSRVIGRSFKRSVMRGVNRFFGGVMGFITGAALAVIVCALLNAMLNILPDGFLGITSVSRDNSIIYKFITQTLNIYIG